MFTLRTAGFVIFFLVFVYLFFCAVLYVLTHTLIVILCMLHRYTGKSSCVTQQTV